jgi:hypothetical protein
MSRPTQNLSFAPTSKPRQLPVDAAVEPTRHGVRMYKGGRQATWPPLLQLEHWFMLFAAGFRPQPKLMMALSNEAIIALVALLATCPSCLLLHWSCIRRASRRRKSTDAAIGLCALCLVCAVERSLANSCGTPFADHPAELWSPLARSNASPQSDLPAGTSFSIAPNAAFPAVLPGMLTPRWVSSLLWHRATNSLESSGQWRDICHHRDEAAGGLLVRADHVPIVRW